MPSGTVTPSGGGGVATVTAADGSIVVAGTASAPTVRTGTLDAIATAHAPVAAVAVNAQKITGLANGAAASDAAAFGQIPAASALAGYVFDYKQITSNVACTATTEGTANTIITGNSVTYDGTSIVLIEFWCGGLQSSQTTDNNVLVLLEDTTVLGSVNWRSDFPGVQLCQGVIRFRRTPAAGAHTYTVKGYTGSGTFTLQCGAGGAGDILMPAFLQVVRVG